MEWSVFDVWFAVGDMMQTTVVSLLFAWENFLGLHYSSIWNMVPACLMWLIWKERNTRIFEDVEKSTDFLKSLLVGTFWVVSYLRFYTMYFRFWFRAICLCFCLICLYLFLVLCSSSWTCCTFFNENIYYLSKIIKK